MSNDLVVDYLQLCTVFGCNKRRIVGSCCCATCYTDLESYWNYYGFRTLDDCVSHFNYGVKFRYDTDCHQKYVTYLMAQVNRCFVDINHVQSKHDIDWRNANMAMKALANAKV